MTFDEFEYTYATTQEKLEKEMWGELRKIEEEYLDQFDFKKGDPIEYEGEFIGWFYSIEFDGEQILLNYHSNEAPEDLCYMDGVNPDLLTIHNAA